MNDDIIQNVLQWHNEMRGVSDIGLRKSDEIVYKELIKLGWHSRQNYILLFNEQFRQSIPDTNIFDCLNSSLHKFYSLLRHPPFYQSLNKLIKKAQNSPSEFAQGIQAFFNNQENEQYLNLFAYLIFPSIYGFFLSEEQLPKAYELIIQLRSQMTGSSFLNPFMISFYYSAHIFLHIFWTSFFEKLASFRNKPTLSHLLEIFFDTLASSTFSLSPSHLALSVELLSADPSLFYDVFFKGFLQPSFRIWIESNPGITTSRISRNNIDELFGYIGTKIPPQDSTTEPHAVFVKLRDIFFQNPFSMCPLISFVRHFPQAMLHVLISPFESLILAKVFELIPSFQKDYYSWSLVTDQSAFDSFTAGCLDLYLPNKKEKTAIRPLFCEDKPMELQDANDENKRKLRIIQRHCKKAGIDPLAFITKKIDPATETIEIKKVREKVSGLIDDSLLAFAITTTQNKLATETADFEQFLMRQHLFTLLGDVSNRILHFQDLLKHSLSTRALYQNLFPEQIVRNSMELDTSSPIVAQYRNLFAKRLDRPASTDPEFTHAIDVQVGQLISSIKIFDELSLGDKLDAIIRLLKRIQELWKEPDNQCLLFIKVLKASKVLTFFPTFLSLVRYQKLKPQSYAKLKPETRDLIEMLIKFIFEKVIEPDQGDAEGTEMKAAIMQYLSK